MFKVKETGLFYICSDICCDERVIYNLFSKLCTHVYWWRFNGGKQIISDSFIFRFRLFRSLQHSIYRNNDDFRFLPVVVQVNNHVHCIISPFKCLNNKSNRECLLPVGVVLPGTYSGGGDWCAEPEVLERHG